MKQHLKGGLGCLLLGLISVSSFAADETDCYPGLPCPEKAGSVTLGPGIITLVRDTELKYPNVVLAEGTTLRTNGHDLKLEVEGNLDIQRDVQVQSFDPAYEHSKPAKASRGADGQSHDPGPNTGGPCASCGGHNGGDAPKAPDGIGGAEGADAGTILITVKGSVAGSLEIVNTGQDGGPGGDGGDGGTGGTGGQGGRATPNEVAFGIAAGCKKGPGHGGRGGQGGMPGIGGPGGSGGNGGIIILALGEDSEFTVSTDVSGGTRGLGGATGSPGVGGEPGFGGRGAKGCEGKETERRGSDGPRGPENPGASENGSDGQGGKVHRL